MASTSQPNVVTVPKKITTKQSARSKLEISQITQQAVQQELMGVDVGIEKMAVYLSSQIRFDISDRITDASISRTMDASSTLTVVINDYDRAVLTSGYLYNKLDVQVDGLWFRLSGVDKSGDELTLTFEDREVAVLRTYNTWKIARRRNVTRAEFILNLIREVKEFKIPVVIPELHAIQPVQRYDGDTAGVDVVTYKRKGIPKQYTQAYTTGDPSKTWLDVPNWNVLKVKGATITKEQWTNANIILDVGTQMGVSRRLKVSAIMTAIVESGIKNLPGGDWTSVGLFQQTDQAPWNSIDRTDPEASSRIYYQHAKKEDLKHPGESLNDLCANVQQPKAIYRDRYGQHQHEANAIVNAYGEPGGSTESLAQLVGNSQYQDLGAGGEFYFYRGTIENRLGQRIRLPENSWSCIQRLAGDVNWKAFFVSGTFYYISEDDLLKQQPAFTMTEWTDGIISVDGNFYEHKNSATLTVTADVGKWIVPPGRLVLVQDMGPWDGRWLVSDFERSLFDIQATITLVREQPGLPEPNPKGGNKTDINPSWAPTTGDAQSNRVGVSGKENPKVTGNRIDLAKQLLKLHNHGWTDYNTGYQQISDTAAGKPLIYPDTGATVDLDPKIIAVIIWLISEKGFDIGTYAWCTDHLTNDGVGGHAGGHAVDISAINSVAVNQLTPQCYKNVLAVDQALNSLTGKLAPRQLISNGYGNTYNALISGYTIPSPAYYGQTTMSEHENHIHVGY